ncbi:hypothetical protein [Natronorubrum sp. FCH18a]|uniref:hypothetical protein n=1 Tax=Natronorubrum sp. FCH18a TaxID=3447018 RepID=UPI003F511452
MRNQDSVDVFRAYCNDCDWTFERRLNEADLSKAINEEIGESVTRNHEFNCGENGPKAPGVIEQDVEELKLEAEQAVVADD